MGKKDHEESKDEQETVELEENQEPSDHKETLAEMANEDFLDLTVKTEKLVLQANKDHKV